MGATVSAAPNQRRLLLGSAAIMAGAMTVSSLATQFVAWRVGFHPAIGAPWFGHFYAPWSWIAWQEAAWAPNATKHIPDRRRGPAGEHRADDAYDGRDLDRAAAAPGAARGRAWHGAFPDRA